MIRPIHNRTPTLSRPGVGGRSSHRNDGLMVAIRVPSSDQRWRGAHARLFLDSVLRLHPERCGHADEQQPDRAREGQRPVMLADEYRDVNQAQFTWLPTFFLRNYHLNIKDSAIFASSVFFAGIVGDALGGIISDWILRRTGNVEAARRNVIAASYLGTLVALVPVLLTHDLTIVTISLGIAFFMLELTIGPIWAVPMDVAPRYAGTASGFVNTGAAVAGIVSPLLFGFIVDRTGNWTLPFAGSIGLLLVGVAATFWMKPQRAVEEEPDVTAAPALI